LIGLGASLVHTPIARWVSYRAPPGRVLPVGAASCFRNIRVVETGLPLFSVYEHGRDEIIVKFAISSEVPRYHERPLEELHVEYR
jgi:hypothetical protein